MAQAVYPSLQRWVDGFYVAKRSQRIAATTIEFYRKRLIHFTDYSQRRGVSTVESIDPALIREWLLHLEEAGHNPGGIHGYYLTLKVFLRWYESEVESPEFRNPIKKLRPAAL